MRRAEEAWERGATEVCLQGGIHPAFTGDYYAGRRARSRTRCRNPRARVLGARGLAGRGDARRAARPTTSCGCATGLARCPARRPRCSTTTCARSSARTRSRPRSGSRCTRRRIGGLRSNNTIMFGHVEGPELGAPPVRAREQQRRTGGFTEFVPLPFVHMEAPMYLRAARAAGRRSARCCSCTRWPARAAPVDRERAGVVGEARPGGRREALRAGVNDLGGTLMNESISRAAGAAWGQEMPPERMEELIRSAAACRASGRRSTARRPGGRRASFGAAPLAEPQNPPLRDAGPRCSSASRAARARRGSPLGRPVRSGAGSRPGKTSDQEDS